MKRLLYAYAEGCEGDPHELVVEVDFTDWPTRQGYPVFPREWMAIEDTTGKSFEVRAADCGRGCFCAAELRPLN